MRYQVEKFANMNVFTFFVFGSVISQCTYSILIIIINNLATTERLRRIRSHSM